MDMSLSKLQETVKDREAWTDQRPGSLLRSDGDEIGLSPVKNLETTRKVRQEDYVTMYFKFCSLDIFYMHILHKINQSADIY